MNKIHAMIQTECEYVTWLAVCFSVLFVCHVFYLHHCRTEIYGQRKWKVQTYQKLNPNPPSITRSLNCSPAFFLSHLPFKPQTLCLAVKNCALPYKAEFKKIFLTLPSHWMSAMWTSRLIFLAWTLEDQSEGLLFKGKDYSLQLWHSSTWFLPSVSQCHILGNDDLTLVWMISEISRKSIQLVKQRYYQNHWKKSLFSKWSSSTTKKFS